MTLRTRRLAPVGLLAALGLALLPAPDPARAQGYAPDEAAKKMTVADGFTVGRGW